MGSRLIENLEILKRTISSSFPIFGVQNSPNIIVEPVSHQESVCVHALTAKGRSQAVDLMPLSLFACMGIIPW